MKRALMAICAVLLLAGCARVMIPPAVDLTTHETIGIIEFRCASQGNLAPYATRRFIQDITIDQKNIGVVELGSEPQALAAVGKTLLDPDAFRALGEKYGVRTIFQGEITISDVKPHISIGPGLSFASFSADVDASLQARLVETATGATVWSGSGTDRQTIGGVSKFGSVFSFDAKDPETAYGALVRSLVRKSTADFRNTWKCRCCK
jgi:hypothetical protein